MRTVISMTSPADVARMLKRAANSPVNYAQNRVTQGVSQEEIEASYAAYQASSEPTEQPLYRSETPEYGQHITLWLPEGESIFEEEAIDERELADSPNTATSGTASRRKPLTDTPTPAIMARKQNQPSTFASLDARDLPVVREYSAGGLIFDARGRVAIIARHSRSGHIEWCLPKGHIERGETPEQTAVREVHEETGILGEVITSIATIDYWFTGSSQRVHKLVHHYALRMIGGELTVEGDPDHEAEDAAWVNFDDLTSVLSYPNERRIAWLYARKYRKQSHE